MKKIKPKSKKEIFEAMMIRPATKKKLAIRKAELDMTFDEVVNYLISLDVK
jgi:hypothetical protein